MKKFNYNLFADYYQFYIQDDDETKGNLGDSWSQEAVERLLAIAPGAVGVGTVRKKYKDIHNYLTKPRA